MDGKQILNFGQGNLETGLYPIKVILTGDACWHDNDQSLVLWKITLFAHMHARLQGRKVVFLLRVSPVIPFRCSFSEIFTQLV